MVNIDVPAGVCAPPFDTTSEHADTDKACQPWQIGNPQHPPTDPPKDTHVLTTTKAHTCMTATGTRLRLLTMRVGISFQQ